MGRGAGRGRPTIGRAAHVLRRSRGLEPRWWSGGPLAVVPCQHSPHNYLTVNIWAPRQLHTLHCCCTYSGKFLEDILVSVMLGLAP